jgi:hypothetical protein
MSTSETPKTPILGYLIIAAAIVLAAFVFSRAPRYVTLESGDLMNQTDGSVYRYVNWDSDKPLYEMRHGPSHRSYGVWPTATTRNATVTQRASE